MSIASTTVRVGEESALRDRSFVGRSGEAVAWLDVGAAGTLGVYGSARAIRRLGEAMVTAADAADELPAQQRQPAGAVH
jgi:hypothetical protein